MGPGRMWPATPLRQVLLCAGIICLLLRRLKHFTDNSSIDTSHCACMNDTTPTLPMMSRNEAVPTAVV